LRLVLLINVYILSSTKLEMRANTICLEARGWGQEEGGREKGRVMTQSLYVHMNKGNKTNK
jgi:hypothetical protein